MRRLTSLHGLLFSHPVCVWRYRPHGSRISNHFTRQSTLWGTQMVQYGDKPVYTESPKTIWPFFFLALFITISPRLAQDLPAVLKIVVPPCIPKTNYHFDKLTWMLIMLNGSYSTNIDTCLMYLMMWSIFFKNFYKISLSYVSSLLKSGLSVELGKFDFENGGRFWENSHRYIVERMNLWQFAFLQL